MDGAKTLYLNRVNLPYQLVIAGFFPSTVFQVQPGSYGKPGLNSLVHRVSLLEGDKDWSFDQRRGKRRIQQRHGGSHENNAGVPYLEDGLPFSKWLITMVIVSPLNGVMGPLPNGLFVAYR